MDQLTKELELFEQTADWSMYKDHEKREIAFRTGYELGFRASQTTDSVSELNEWRKLALSAGEKLATTGPDGYYSFTWDQFSNWLAGQKSVAPSPDSVQGGRVTGQEIIKKWADETDQFVHGSDWDLLSKMINDALRATLTPEVTP